LRRFAAGIVAYRIGVVIIGLLIPDLPGETGYEA
jgi:hypothetical protein